MREKYTLTITTAQTVRLSRALIDAFEPREQTYYFTPEITLGLVILRRSDTPTWFRLNSRTQYIGTRFLADRMLRQGFKPGIKYPVTISGDSMVLACRNIDPAGETKQADDVSGVSNEERRARQARLIEMIHGHTG